MAVLDDTSLTMNAVSSRVFARKKEKNSEGFFSKFYSYLCGKKRRYWERVIVYICSIVEQCFQQLPHRKICVFDKSYKQNKQYCHSFIQEDYFHF